MKVAGETLCVLRGAEGAKTTERIVRNSQAKGSQPDEPVEAYDTV